MIHRTALSALALTLALTACAGDSPDTATAAPSSAAPSASSPSPTDADSGAQVVELTIAGGEVSGDTGRVQVPLGTTVLLRVTSDVADEVHVHGVDEYVDLAPGQVAEERFVADVAGVFEVELHDAGTLLTRLQVQ